MLQNSNRIYAKTATATALSLQTVLSTFTIEKISDLNFGEAPQSDPDKVIAPGRSENYENASFEIIAEKGQTFTIILPTDNTIKMTIDSGGMNKEITVTNFTSFPSNQITIGAQSKELLFIGATRKKLSATQKPGKYIGQFTVSIVY